jgi:hypothetical protein
MVFCQAASFFSRLKGKAPVTIQMTDPLIDLIRLCLKITLIPHSEERFHLVKSINVMLEKFPEELQGNPVANHMMIAVIVAVSADM